MRVCIAVNIDYKTTLFIWKKKRQNKKLGNDEFVISRNGRKEFINTMEAGVEIKSA